MSYPEPEIGTREWWNTITRPFTPRGVVDAILRLLEQEAISRGKARELLAYWYNPGPDIRRPKPLPAAPWEELNWCDDSTPRIPDEAMVVAVVHDSEEPHLLDGWVVTLNGRTLHTVATETEADQLAARFRAALAAQQGKPA